MFADGKGRFNTGGQMGLQRKEAKAKKTTLVSTGAATNL